MSTGEIIALLVACVSLGVAVGSFVRSQATARRLKTIFAGESIQDVDQLIEAYAERFGDIDGQIRQILETLNQQDTRISSTLGKVGLKRFNPFQDMGGDMSFILALLDESNTGVLITNIVMRDGNRIYAKHISAGTATLTLSEEEQEILTQTMRQDLSQ